MEDHFFHFYLFAGSLQFILRVQNARIMLKNGRITVEEIPSFFQKITLEDAKELEAIKGPFIGGGIYLTKPYIKPQQMVKYSGFTFCK